MFVCLFLVLTLVSYLYSLDINHSGREGPGERQRKQ